MIATTGPDAPDGAGAAPAPPPAPAAPALAPPDAEYGPAYYSSHCGTVPYGRTGFWLDLFAAVAAEVVRALRPRRVFDAGCAMGLLVEALWDRGVEAHGRDVSRFAVSEVRADVRPFCAVGSIAEPIEGEWDLVCCIEVLEHMEEADALRAIAGMTAAAPRVLFSSSPTDLSEPTHRTVRPPIFWLRAFAAHGFAPAPGFDAGFVAPHALLFERAPPAARATADASSGPTPDARGGLASDARGGPAPDARGGLLPDARGGLPAPDAAPGPVPEAVLLAAAELVRLRVALDGRDRRHAALLAQSDALREEGGRARRDAEAAARDALERAGREDAAAREAGLLRGRAAALEVELAAARARGEALDALLPALHAPPPTPAAAAEADDAELRRLRLELAAVHASASWRVSAPVRAGSRLLAAVLPAGARRRLGGAARLLWWAGSFQLGTRLARRRETLERARRVAGSGLLDPAWYRASYPDAAASGLDPALHYVAFGAAGGKNPGPAFDTDFYCRQDPPITDPYGDNPVLHFLDHGRAAGRPVRPGGGAIPAPAAPVAAPSGPGAETPSGPALPPAAAAQLAARFPQLAPLAVAFAPAPGEGARLTVVTDSIGAGSLYGGVATALVLAALLATRLGATLRLLTRTEPGEAAVLARVLALHGVPWSGNVELRHAPPGAAPVPMHDGDVLLTTAWWATRPVLGAVDPRRVVALVQEDERMFYPHGDDRLRCAETLDDPRLLTVVNSEGLFRHLTEGADALPGLRARGCFFEPAFPTARADADALRARAAGGRRNLLFYARPQNVRNLYWRGLEALDAALSDGTLDPAEWDVTFVGRELSPVRLAGGVRPRVLQNLPWDEYSALVRAQDLGLTLMDTPHPSYPPLDLAASGAVAVTNRTAGKHSLARYSANVICAEPTVAGLLAGLREGAALARDPERRLANLAADGLARDWAGTLAPVLDRLERELRG